MTDKYLLRSLMFVPGHKEKLLKSAVKSNADALLLDLEDSVQPKSNKAIARNNIKKFITNGSLKKFHIFPRVNDRESGELLQDITQLALPDVDGFMYPKAKTELDIYFFDKLLETIEYERGFDIGKFKIIALIETASAVLNAESIAKASPRVIGIAFGNEDFLMDIKGKNDLEASPLFTPRAMIAMAAHSSDVIPIDTVHIKVHDLEDLEYNLKIAVKLGFSGKLVLHPKELELVHEYFSPSTEEIEQARRMIKSYDESEKQGIGVAIVDGKFIGPPLVRSAKKILSLNTLISNKISK